MARAGVGCARKNPVVLGLARLLLYRWVMRSTPVVSTILSVSMFAACSADLAPLGKSVGNEELDVRVMSAQFAAEEGGFNHGVTFGFDPERADNLTLGTDCYEGDNEIPCLALIAHGDFEPEDFKIEGPGNPVITPYPRDYWAPNSANMVLTLKEKGIYTILSKNPLQPGLAGKENRKSVIRASKIMMGEEFVNPVIAFGELTDGYLAAFQGQLVHAEKHFTPRGTDDARPEFAVAMGPLVLDGNAHGMEKTSAIVDGLLSLLDAAYVAESLAPNTIFVLNSFARQMNLCMADYVVTESPAERPDHASAGLTSEMIQDCWTDYQGILEPALAEIPTPELPAVTSSDN